MEYGCVLCGDKAGCKYCRPGIPEWYRKAIPSKRRTHEQLSAVQSGLHPNGREESGSHTIKCGSCKFRQEVPGSRKYKWCTMAVSVDHRLTTVHMNSCVKYQFGDEIKQLSFQLREVQL